MFTTLGTFSRSSCGDRAPAAIACLLNLPSRSSPLLTTYDERALPSIGVCMCARARIIYRSNTCLFVPRCLPASPCFVVRRLWTCGAEKPLAAECSGSQGLTHSSEPKRLPALDNLQTSADKVLLTTVDGKKSSDSEALFRIAVVWCGEQ